MKKNKGFTLIELLAVIVILAVIALIAVPQILNILNKSRISAAEDTTYGIAKAGESYVTSFMLTNNGDMPSEDLEFSCSKENGCRLTTTLTGYDLTNLNSLDFKGTKPTKGTVTISDNGKKVSATNLVINGFTCNYEDGKASCSQGGTEPISYYAFGKPDTSSTTDYTTLGKNVFARLGEDNSKGVCIIDGGKLFCINTNDYDKSAAAIKEHFGADNCRDRGSNVRCDSDAFSCNADFNGIVDCSDNATGENCYALGDGSFSCS